MKRKPEEELEPIRKFKCQSVTKTPGSNGSVGEDLPSCSNLHGDMMNMSEADLEHFKFLMDLNEQSQLGWTKSDVLSFIYPGRLQNHQRPSPTPSVYFSSIACQKNSQLSGNSTSVPDRPLDLLVDANAESNSETQFNGTLCFDLKESQSTHYRKPGGETSSGISPDPGTLSRDSVSLSKGNGVCALGGGDGPCLRGKFLTVRRHEYPNSQLVPSMPGMCCRSAQSKITESFGPACQQDHSLTKAKSAFTVQTSRSKHEESVRRDPMFGMATTDFSTNDKDSSISGDQENLKTKYWHVIRLSERECLLLRQLYDFLKWCKTLNEVLRRRNVHMVLIPQRSEIYVSGEDSFSQMRSQILKDIRSAAVWWDLRRTKSQTGKFMAGTEVQKYIIEAANEPKEDTRRPKSRQAKLSCTTVTGEEELKQEVTSISESTTDAHDQSFELKCQSFVDPQLTTESANIPSHRIVLRAFDHQRLLQHDKKFQVIRKLNGSLKSQNLRISLLQQRPELHISGCNVQKLSQVVAYVKCLLRQLS